MAAMLRLATDVHVHESCPRINNEEPSIRFMQIQDSILDLHKLTNFIATDLF